jgi:PPOX class probable FMN-dependent enzyme
MAITVEPRVGSFQKVVTSKAELRAIMGEPSGRAVWKEHATLDEHSRNFIAHSPFLLLGTASANGDCDVSPKGDAPGFVRVLDEHTLVIPDRKGNRRIDSLLNVVDNPHVGLLFLIPGMDETLRVNGRAVVVQDDALLDSMIVEGKRPQVAIVVTVEQVFLHCARSFLRSHLWDPTRFVSPTALPSFSRMILDLTRPADRPDEEHEKLVKEAEDATCEAYKVLY